jgi:hypothetical protein
VPISRFYHKEVSYNSRLIAEAHSSEDILKADSVLSSDSYGIDAMVSLPTFESGSMIPAYSFTLCRQKQLCNIRY